MSVDDSMRTDDAMSRISSISEEELCVAFRLSSSEGHTVDVMACK